MNAERAAHIYPVLVYLQSINVTLSELLLSVLVFRCCNDISIPLYQDLIANTDSILSAFRFHDRTANSTRNWAHRLMSARYLDDLQELTSTSHGWHFSAAHAQPEQIQDFQLEVMAMELARTAPELWSLVRSLLSGAPARDVNITLDVDDQASGDGLDLEVEDLWDMVGDLPGGPEEAVSLEGLGVRSQRRLRELRDSLTDIKTVVVVSILMQHRDQRCNSLQSVFGMFLHSCNAPEKLVKVLAHMGLSISLASIHRALYSLSGKCETTLRELGQTLLVSHGYDNFDAESRALIPTVEGSKERLMHLTSGAMFRLDHGVTLEDLRCSRLLWDRSSSNHLATDPRPFDPHATIYHLLTLHPELPLPSSGLSRRGRFRAWFFQRTLFLHGPQYFRQSLSDLSDPEPVEMIPVTKLQYLPYRAMDINQSKTAGNIDALENIFAQAGIGDPTRPGSGLVTDISEYVTIVHGDLGTYERVLSAKRQRKQEKTPFNRLQSVEFAIGLFHLKMAAADAIWRMEVSPDHAREDPTSFLKICGKLRPDDSSRLVSNAKFREQHELIGHVGTLLRLDAWRVEVERSTTHSSLESWASSRPSVAEIEEVARRLVLNYVEGDGIDIHGLRSRSSDIRDKVQENTMRTHNYLLLYEELSYALNAGDIGRFETLVVPWVLLFRGTGKHKYGTQTLRFMHALYFIYPDGLRKAIRYNILVNPSGKPHQFRAVDWVLELINLYIKYLYGGGGPNNTKERILLESILVLLFRNSLANFERNFKLSGLSFAHAEKDMRKTFEIVLRYLSGEDRQPNMYKAGRSSHYVKPDILGKGSELVEKDTVGQREEGTNEQDGENEEGETGGAGVSADDLSAEGPI